MSDDVQLTREELDEAGVKGVYTQEEVNAIEEKYQEALDAASKNKEAEMVFQNLEEVGVPKDNWPETLKYMVGNKMENTPSEVKKAAVSLGFLKAVDMNGVAKSHELNQKVSEFFNTTKEEEESKPERNPDWNTAEAATKRHNTKPYWQDRAETASDKAKAKVREYFPQEEV